MDRDTTKKKKENYRPVSLMNLLWESRTETGDTKAFQEAIFISVLAAAQWFHIQRLSPKTKGSPLIYPCKQVTEAKVKV
jgi:hypothetical protein